MSGAGVGAPLRLPAILLSPAALLLLASSILADGTRGPWAAVTLAAGAVLVALVLSGPWTRAEPPGAVEVVTSRWAPGAPSLAPLALAETLTAVAFTWAQLSALRGLALAAGWWPHPTVAVATALLAVLAWNARAPRRLLDAGAALLAVGLVVPLVAVLVTTTPVWPRVWAEVAARPRLAFPEDGAWTREGASVRGEGADGAVLAFTEEQTVTVFGPGPVRLLPWESRDGGREVAANAEVVVRAGDRLTVAAGARVRFEAGRRIPGAPATGVDWASPRGPNPGSAALAGLALTLALGALGLPAVATGLGKPRAARTGAGLAVAAAAAALLWGLYAAWLTPEVYAGGVAGSEIYELPARVAALRPVGEALRVLSLGGLMAGALAAALSALAGVARRRRQSARRGAVGLVLGLAGGALAMVSDVGPAVPLVLAFGLAASALAPAATLARWSERVTARSLGAGAAVGLVTFLALGLCGLALRVGPGQMLASGPLGDVLAWPALAALPANVLVAWLRLAPVGVSPRSPLPDGLAELHDWTAARLQASGGSGTMSFSRGS